MSEPIQNPKEKRRQEWLNGLIAKGSIVETVQRLQDEILDRMEEAYTAGWSDCFDVTRQESSAERADRD